MAFQVAGKAARDALFLSSFRPSQLPPMIVAGALSAILLGIANGRLLGRVPPKRIVPALLFLSGGLNVLEYLISGRSPRIIAVAVYIHVVALGAVITSGFWSVINEQFDPYTAKQNFGRIAAAGTAGGVLGGFLSERLAVYANSHAVLLLLAAAQIVTGVVLFAMPAAPVQARREVARARDLLRKSSYLRTLSLLVLSGTFSAALFDYVLKADAGHSLKAGEPLMRFFALFHTGTAALAFLLQTTATAPLLNRFGLGAAMATLPASVAAGGLFAVLFRGFATVTAARGLEAVIRGSFFRAGYELVYTPMPASEKRAVKSINDVTIDRLGDALGGVFAQAAIRLGSVSGTVMLVTGAASSAAGWLLARRLQRGYVRMLERSLEYHASDEETEEPVENCAPEPVVAGTDPPPQREALPATIAWLADPVLRRGARRAIASVASANVGQLSDFLLDPATDPEVRRQLPSLIATSGIPRAVDGLLAGLALPERRLRRECARALDNLQQPVDSGPVYTAIREELNIARPDLDYVFILLSLVLPRDSVRLAQDSLKGRDQHLRGIAFEYLETALPAEISEPLLEAAGASISAPDLAIAS